VLGPGDERAGADALVASHADYPAFRSVFPDATRRERALRPFFEATLRDAIPFGHVLGAWADTHVLGVGAWLPPGAFPWTAGRKARAALSFMRVLAGDPRSFLKFTRYGANAEEAHPADQHWYLVVLGIRPDAQRHGWGRQLLGPVIGHADKFGQDCFLETSDPANIDYYRRFGFEIENAALELVPGGPTHTAMRRRPQRPYR